jgi:very-short-patch-repair endonuclease
MNPRDADNLDVLKRALHESPLESTLLFQLRAEGLPTPETQVRFDDTRRWRFDFAWPSARLAVEVNGGEWSQGRHNRAAGMRGDYEKINTATIQGWRVLQFAGSQVTDGSAVLVIRAALAEFDT